MEHGVAVCVRSIDPHPGLQHRVASVHVVVGSRLMQVVQGALECRGGGAGAVEPRNGLQVVIFRGGSCRHVASGAGAPLPLNRLSQSVR
jgi:hypothetical protein